MRSAASRRLAPLRSLSPVFGRPGGGRYAVWVEGVVVSERQADSFRLDQTYVFLKDGGSAPLVPSGGFWQELMSGQPKSPGVALVAVAAVGLLPSTPSSVMVRRGRCTPRAMSCSRC